jgi:hypothetical protein
MHHAVLCEWIELHGQQHGHPQPGERSRYEILCIRIAHPFAAKLRSVLRMAQQIR